jgi:quinol monooxygenase YgiN
MIYEMATIQVTTGCEIEFMEAVLKAKPLFMAADGCHGIELHQSIEQPSSFTLIVKWDNVEAHTIHFRNSTAFAEWRALVGGFFAAPPQVHHSVKVLGSSE